ncbi:hypothetical protein ARMSODRAFT_1017583 [Armillaria solidipes]|uniref:HMG box domain-containing protein n=1 Tax=Armillaria solidipes TaxID=1076256 RepID=A0A2H3BIV9_9AGAR|nr:hypothetical protein ARMSODRAFT_1017583 [Armillaria solidipes]
MTETSQTQTAIPVPPAPRAVRPDCPTLTKEHTTWLNENVMLGYAQVVAAAQAQSSGGKRVRGPGIDYVKDHVLNDFLEKFWSPDDEPKTASVLLKLRKYLANHHKAYSEKTRFDPRTQPPPARRTNAKDQFRKVKAKEIKAEMAKRSADGNVPDDLDLYRDVSAAMWAALDSDAVEEFQAMAKEANAHAAELPSLGDIYQNQRLIDQATTSMLERMIGFGPGQLGKVAWIAHCMYEDADGKVCGVNVKIHSKSNSWAAVPDNDLNSEEYFKAAIKWAARGFDGDQSTIPSEGQKTAAAQAKSDTDKRGDRSSKSSDSPSHKNKQAATTKANQASTAKPSNAVDDHDEDEEDNNNEEGDDNDDNDDNESAKVQAALANAAAAKKRKEKAAKEAEERAARDAEERVEREESETEDKGSKHGGKGGRGKKRVAEEVAGDVAPPPPPKRRGHAPKDTTDNSELEPRRSARSGKGENHKNYKLADGKYTGK